METTVISVIISNARVVHRTIVKRPIKILFLTGNTLISKKVTMTDAIKEIALNIMI